eukprot:15882-Eustigmatos_ZCMA.PRE.1
MGIAAREPDGSYKLIPDKPFVFNENPVTVSVSRTVSIKTKSSSVPGIEIKRERDPSATITPNEKTKLRGFDIKELQLYLSDLEFASYQSAAKLGNKARLVELNAIVASRKE